jgi:hypothetical protein
MKRDIETAVTNHASIPPLSHIIADYLLVPTLSSSHSGPISYLTIVNNRATAVLIDAKRAATSYFDAETIEEVFPVIEKNKTLHTQGWVYIFDPSDPRNEKDFGDFSVTIRRRDVTLRRDGKDASCPVVGVCCCNEITQ